MKKLLFPTVLSCTLFLACKKDMDDNLDLTGVYAETIPVNGRSQIKFLPGNIMVRMEPGTAMHDSFHYAITKGKMMLSPTWTNTYQDVEFEFKVLDKTTFQIENLYPQIPEFSKTFITYKK